jgi:hypothetical protein
MIFYSTGLFLALLIPFLLLLWLVVRLAMANKTAPLIAICIGCLGMMASILGFLVA